MKQLLRFWFGLCVLAAAPQDLSASRTVLLVSTGSYLLVSMTLAAMTGGFRDGAQAALLELGLLLLFVAGLLYLTGRPARIGQTLAALTGSGSLLGLPAVLLVAVTGAAATTGPAAVAWLLLLLWNLLVNAHIMRHALSGSLALGFGVSLVYMLISTEIILAGFPQLAAGAAP
ncbi:MAG: hypothetical protein R3F42_15030 [Pseudomonadota bacterium]